MEAVHATAGGALSMLRDYSSPRPGPASYDVLRPAHTQVQAQDVHYEEVCSIRGTQAILSALRKHLHQHEQWTSMR